MRTRWFLLILCVAFAVRFAAAFYWQRNYCVENPFFFGDSVTYWELGRSIAESVRTSDWKYEWGDQPWKIFRTPGYPVILAPLFLLFDDSPPILTARILGAVLGTLTVAAVAWLSRILFQPFFQDARKTNIAVLFSALVVALEPCQILTSILILSEAPFCLFMVLQIAFWILALQRMEKSRFSVFCCFMLSGLLYAVAVYCRPSWLYFVPFAFCFHCVFLLPGAIRQKSWQSFSRQLFGYATILVVFVLAMSPWWIRNYHVSGRFVATSLQMGPSLYDGLGPQADGSSQMDFVDHFREQERQLDKQHQAGQLDAHFDDYFRYIYEYRVDQRMKRAAIDWAKQNPDRVLELVWIKVVRLWNVWPNEPSFSSFPVRIAIFSTYVPILILAIAGIIATWKTGFAFWLCWIPAIYFTSLHIIFVSSLRYRIPPMLLLIVLAGGFFAKILKYRKKSD